MIDEGENRALIQKGRNGLAEGKNRSMNACSHLQNGKARQSTTIFQYRAQVPMCHRQR